MEYWSQLLLVCLIWAVASPGVTGRNGTSSSSDDNAAAPYGGIIFSGGYYTKDGDELDSIEIIGVFALPALPSTLHAHTLTPIGTNLYECKDYQCDTIDTKTVNPNWSKFADLPVGVYDHTAVSIDSNIWIVFMGYLYNLDTQTGDVATYTLPFVVETGHCSVSNSTHSFVFGAGANRNEIWVNAEAHNPYLWVKAGYMGFDRIYFGCLWHGNTVFITGGETSPTSSFAFDVNSHVISRLTDLNTGRYSHRMFMLNDKPAVAGGMNDGYFFTSAETYDEETKNWTTTYWELDQARASFALAEVYELVS